jgi:DNA-binding XRE family transcriptional regulator
MRSGEATGTAVAGEPRGKTGPQERPGGEPGSTVSATDQRVVLGRTIAGQRRRHGLSQAELARLLGRPAGWVSLTERGLVQAEPLLLLAVRLAATGASRNTASVPRR